MGDHRKRAKLTKSYVDRIKPDAKLVFHWDTELRGFAALMAPSGRLTFIVQGRVNETNAPSARITIGAYGVFTVDQARDAAREHLRSMRMGTDPRQSKKAEAAMKVTLSDVCTAYISRPGRLKQSTKDEYKSHVDKVFAVWKDQPLVSITEDAVRKRHREMVEGGLDGKKGAPASANASMVTLRILINFANRQYRRADGSLLIARNPIDVLRDHWAPLGSRIKRYIDKSRVGAAWNALDASRGTARNREALAGIELVMFLLLTGARISEGAELTWDRVNIDDENPENCLFHLPDPKNGREVFLPLSMQAVDLLKRRYASRPKPPEGTDSPFVFPTWSKTGHITDPRAALELVSKIAGQHLSCHDLRRTFTNIAMRECLIEKFRTDLLTNHTPAQEDVTSRHYLDLSNLSWLNPDVQKIGDWIEHQAAKASGANVVPLRA